MIREECTRQNNNMPDIDIVSSRKGRKDQENNKTSALIEYIKELKDERFTGYIKINFSQGGIARVEKFEEVLNIRKPFEVE